MKVVGLMSGTSMDGIDAALVDLEVEDSESDAAGFPELRWRLLAFESSSYSDRRRSLLREAVEGTARTAGIGKLHREVGEWLGEAVRSVCRIAGMETAELDLVGSHGHTVWHQPPGPADPGLDHEPHPGLGAEAESGSETGTVSEPLHGFSLQLGNPAVLAEATGVPVVSDFRSADLAAGGQGAPLVPFADALLFSAADTSRALQNLGGMANVTLLPPRGSDREILAFDTGPGVALLDAAAELATAGALRFDRDGALAARGDPDPALLDRLMAHPFFERPPPRSTGRELFGSALVRTLAAERGLVGDELTEEEHPGRSLDEGGRRAEPPGEAPPVEDGWADLLATLTAFSARSIGDAYRRWVVPRGVDEVFLTGGGARNPELVEAIRREMSPLPVRPSAELGLDADAREAVAFAVLAWAHVRGIPGNVPAATGARGPRVLGSLTPAPR